jgi:hypothetical protein
MKDPLTLLKGNDHRVDSGFLLITILGKSSSRADFILEQLPDDAAGKAYRLDVMLSHMPKNRLEAIVEEVKAGAKTLLDAGNEIAEYIGA